MKLRQLYSPLGLSIIGLLMATSALVSSIRMYHNVVELSGMLKYSCSLTQRAIDLAKGYEHGRDSVQALLDSSRIAGTVKLK